ncbi:hypothetical protein SUGI_0656070 [Cryptomeria japonica]|nr:hypothetical protein SUGI_0656070 [Cryptomeria japonica]
MKVWIDKNWGSHLHIRNIRNGYFLIEFPSKDERWAVLNHGPYMMDGSNIYMIEWCGNFDSWKHKMDGSLVKVRIYNLPFEYWEEYILKEIGEKLGTRTQIDKKMEDNRFGTYARIFLSLIPFPPLP